MIELAQGDITDLSVDAIVNAANSHLSLGGGVAGAIRKKGGPSIQKECSAIKYCPVGQAVITKGGRLKARHVIHTVGPLWGEGDEDEKLMNAVQNSLILAANNHLSSIALPAIATGNFGFPMERAAKICLETAKKYSLNRTSIQRIIFCLLDQPAYDIFSHTLTELKVASPHLKNP